ncbi:MAG: right-handed parallel beta-helix repeat-containing protein [Putridiphycobacter sp.]
MKKGMILMMASALVLTGVSCKKKGCTDPLANNYSEKATKDDGSCDYAPVAYDGGNITSNTTLDDKNIQICDDIYVSAGLTIPSGTTIIMCEGASLTIESNGYINAVGTATEPITIKGESETPGFWEGIAILSNNPNNQLSHVTIKDAGTYWGWKYAGLYIGENAKVSMSNTTISNHETYGMYVENDGQLSTFSNNTFANCETGLSLPAKQLNKIDAASNYNSNNTNNFIEARSSTISTDQTWPKTSTPILVNDVYVSAGLTLTAGSTILMEANQAFEVESTGFLNATGTASEPITISGRYASAGYWAGITYLSNNPNNKLVYTNISDGGQYWGYEYAGVEVEGRLEISNSSISNSNSYGLYVHNTAQLYSGGTVQTTAAGVEANNTFTNNGSGANANCTSGCTVYFQP